MDWFDPELNHNYVTPETAAVLRTRMSQCKSMIYAFSENSSNSKWVPWELGYFDALNDSKIAVLPISKYTKKSYVGFAYVGLYYHIQIDRIKNSEKEALWVKTMLFIQVGFIETNPLGIRQYENTNNSSCFVSS